MPFSHQNEVNFLPKADTASVSLPACSAAPPGRILEKTLSPSPPGCPVAMPAGPRGPAVLGPALLSAAPRGCADGALPGCCGTFAAGLDVSVGSAFVTGAGCPPGCVWSVAGAFPAAWAGPGCCCGDRDEGGPCVLPLVSGCAELAGWAAWRAAGCCRAAGCPACCCLAAACCGCARGSFGAGVADPCGWEGFCALGVSVPWW